MRRAGVDESLMFMDDREEDEAALPPSLESGQEVNFDEEDASLFR